RGRQPSGLVVDQPRRRHPSSGRKAMMAHRVILVVEDHAPLLRVIAEMLERFGYDARLAGTAADAYTFAKAERPDTILLDMNLPDANGTQTLDVLRLLRPDVPIIMVTANADVRLARETLTRRAVGD